MKSIILCLCVLLMVGCSSLTDEESMTKKELEECNGKSTIFGPIDYKYLVTDDGFGQRNMDFCTIRYVAHNGYLNRKKAKILLTQYYSMVDSRLDEFIAMAKADIEAINNGSKYFENIGSYQNYKADISSRITSLEVPLHFSTSIWTDYDVSMLKQMQAFRSKTALLTDETKKLSSTIQSSKKIHTYLKNSVISSLTIKNSKLKNSFAELIVSKELEVRNSISLYGFDSLNNIINNGLINAKNADGDIVTILQNPNIIGDSKFVIKIISGKTNSNKSVLSQEEVESEKVVRVSKVKNQNYVILQQALRNAELRRSAASTRSTMSLLSNFSDMALNGPQDTSTMLNNNLIQAENNSMEGLANMSVEQLQADINNTPEFLFNLQTRQYIYDKYVIKVNRISNYYIEIRDVANKLAFKSNIFLVKDEKILDFVQGFSCEDMNFYDESTGVKKECTVKKDKDNFDLYLKSPAIGIDWQDAFLSEIPKLTFSEISYR